LCGMQIIRRLASMSRKTRKKLLKLQVEELRLSLLTARLLQSDPRRAVTPVIRMCNAN